MESRPEAGEWRMWRYLELTKFLGGAGGKMGEPGI